MDALAGVLCPLAILGAAVWAMDLLLFAPVRALRRWERRQERIARAAEATARQVAANRDAERAPVHGAADHAARAEEIIARVTGKVPDPSDGPAARPALRLIAGGPGAEPPADLATPQSIPEQRNPDLPPGPPFPPGQFRLELPDPDGPQLTVWQRNYVRAALMRVGAEMKGKTFKELTVAEAEAIVAAMGGKPWKLYTGGRAWGQKSYR